MVARPTLRRLRWPTLAFLILVIVLAWPRDDAARQRDEARRLIASGVLRIGIDASYPPFASWQDGQLVGFDVDLGLALAEALGVEARFVPLSFDGLYDALKTVQVDVLISALVYNPARTAEVAYTRPYYDNGLLLVSRAERPLDAMAAIVGLRLAYQYGSDADTEARKWARRIADFDIMPYELPTHALDALCLSQADAALVEATTYFLHARQSKKLGRTCPAHAIYVTHNPYVVATRLDQPALRNALDSLIESFQRTGRIDTLRAKWL
ncbi:MAG: ABC transporter substrate-binding protein [Anaerolineae bacterium]|nr:ABC transporter substrate-binding protein [Anaerolineae bacterium]MDW8173144.1 ABC transporter substrate-binding protein [Anaerolineae bacterium]